MVEACIIIAKLSAIGLMLFRGMISYSSCFLYVKLLFSVLVVQLVLQTIALVSNSFLKPFLSIKRFQIVTDFMSLSFAE